MTMACFSRYGVVLALTLLLMGLFYGSFSLEGAYQAQYWGVRAPYSKILRSEPAC